MSLVYAGVCCHAPGITARTEQGDPELVDGLHRAFDRQRQNLRNQLEIISARRAEAERRQTEARETLIHEPVMEVLQAHLNKPVSAASIEAGDDIVDEFDGEEGDRQFVRNLVTVTMLRQELSDNPIIRDIKQKDKIIGQALLAMEGWQSCGHVRRNGVKARWYARVGPDTSQEYVPMSEGFGIDRTDSDEDPSVDDLLG